MVTKLKVFKVTTSLASNVPNFLRTYIQYSCSITVHNINKFTLVIRITLNVNSQIFYNILKQFFKSPF